jgi:type IV pilus assembly protein PilA
MLGTLIGPSDDRSRDDAPTLFGRELVEGAAAGFTLIELMMVMLIMAVLLAIAIPTFFGVKTNAGIRSTQSNLTNGITAIKAVILLQGQFPTNLAGASQAYQVIDEPELYFTFAPVMSQQGYTLSATTSADGKIVILAAQSPDGRCWYAEDDEEAMANYTDSLTGAGGHQGVTYNASPTPQASCSAQNPVLVNATWTASYPP